MQKAAFSIVKYQFDRVNINLAHHKSSEIILDFDTHGVYYEGNSTYELRFSVKAFNDTVENSFAEVHCVGTFSFENVKNIEEIPDFFYRNSIAILFPFVRAYVSIVTIQANVPAIMLPTLNLMSLEEVLRNNTIQK